jgi:hypothetical protein
VTLRDFLERPAWALRQLLPLHYRTRYTDSDGRRHFVVWRMWFGRSFDIDDEVTQ